MSEKKNHHNPNATIEKEGYELFDVKPMSKAIGDPFAPPLDAEVIANAEAALEELAPEFDNWMADGVHELSQQFIRFAASKGGNRDAIDAFYRSAHDLRGQAATLGYPLISDIAGSLCQIIESTGEDETPPMTIMRHGVDAIQAVVREDVRTELNETGRALAGMLRQMSSEYCAEREDGDKEDQQEAS